MTDPARPAAEALHPLSKALLADPSIRARFLHDVTMGKPRPGSLPWLSRRLAAIEAAVRADATRAAEAEVAALRALLTEAVALVPKPTLPFGPPSRRTLQQRHIDWHSEATRILAALAARPAAPPAEDAARCQCDIVGDGMPSCPAHRSPR